MFCIVVSCRNFVKTMIIAQETATKKKKSVQIVWRGYKDVVLPSEPLFTDDVLRYRLILALRSILKSSKGESFDEKEEAVRYNNNT